LSSLIEHDLDYANAVESASGANKKASTVGHFKDGANLAKVEGTTINKLATGDQMDALGLFSVFHSSSSIAFMSVKTSLCCSQIKRK
jgi:hypothetical protein